MTSAYAAPPAERLVEAREPLSATVSVLAATEGCKNMMAASTPEADA